MFQLRRCNFSGFCEVKGSGRGREGARGGGETLQWDCSQIEWDEESDEPSQCMATAEGRGTAL